jgi:hypothetical protein
MPFTANEHWVFERGNIPEEYWDRNLTPTPTQLAIILDLINSKYFNDYSPHPAVQSDFEYAMAAIETLGDTRWVSAGEFIDTLIHFPNLED